jgi:hypothetical protein
MFIMFSTDSILYDVSSEAEETVGHQAHCIRECVLCEVRLRLKEQLSNLKDEIKADKETADNSGCGEAREY